MDYVIHQNLEILDYNNLFQGTLDEVDNRQSKDVQENRIFCSILKLIRKIEVVKYWIKTFQNRDQFLQ